MSPKSWLIPALALGLGAIAFAWVRSRSGADARAEKEVAALYRESRTREAYDRVGAWLKGSPDNPEAQVWKARLALTLRRFADAEEALVRAKALGSPGAERDLLVAIADALNGRFPAVEPTLRDAFNAHARPDPLLDEVLSQNYLENYNLLYAAMTLKRWKAEAPRDPKPYLWQAEIDTRKEDTPAALEDYRAALRLDPDSPAARLGLAETLSHAHRNAEATAAYDDYLAVKPDDPVGRLGAGRNAVEAGDAEAAARHLERALELDPNLALAHRLLAEVVARRGDFPKALDHLDRAEALDPYEIETRYSRGLVLARLGRAEEAKAERAVFARLRDEAFALGEAQRQLVTAPADLRAKLTITRWLFTHGKPAEAVRWAESILRERPGQPNAAGMLVDHYARIGQPGRANFYRSQADPNAPSVPIDETPPARKPSAR